MSHLFLAVSGYSVHQVLYYRHPFLCWMPHQLSKTVQKLYKMYTKIIQNTIFLHILYKKIVQEIYKKCTSNSYIYRKNVQITKLVQRTHLKSLKLEMRILFTYKQRKNYQKTMQLAKWNCLCIFFLSIYTMYKLYKICTNINIGGYQYVFCLHKNSTFFTFQNLHSNSKHSNAPSSVVFLELCKIPRPAFSYSKSYTDEFIL